MDILHKEYNLFAWLRAQGAWMLKNRQWRGGYATIAEEPPTVHFVCFRWLLWWPKYAAYIQRVLAHEHHHARTRSAWHDTEPGDIMSTSVWNATTDKQSAMAASAKWRKKVLP